MMVLKSEDVATDFMESWMSDGVGSERE